MLHRSEYRRPESVLIVIYSGEKVLLLRRCQPPDVWQSVTGSLEWGESVMQAAHRELMEETGFASEALVDTGQRHRFRIAGPWRPRYHPDDVFNTEHVLTVALAKPLIPVLSASEHDDYRWLDWPTAARQVAFAGNRLAIERLYGRA